MANMTYVDFDLLIEQTAEGYIIRVLNSPSGQAKAQFTLPFSDSELENFFLRIGHSRSVEHRDAYVQDQLEIETVKEFGSRLFEVIFKEDVGKRLDSSLHETSRQGKGLRIRLRLLDAPQLADVPWEYLYNPALNRFLALSVETPIVRYLALPEGIKPLSVELPLKVLVMISSPRDYPSLDVNREWDKLKEALCDLEQKGLVKLEMLESATLSTLQHQLLKDEYHVFHFIGHGGFDKRTQDGVLILEDDEGYGCLVNGQKLGTILHDERTLRLVVLNACEGARTSRNDPFAGTAQSLVQQGIPAVIAMQFEITDKAAIILSHTFYQSVAYGYPLDFALAEARKAIHSAQDFDSVEWGTPVLYMRSSDGNIFDIEGVTGKEKIVSLKEEAQASMENMDWKSAITKWQAVLDIDKDNSEAERGLKRARWMKYHLRLWIGISALMLALAGVIFAPKIFPSKSIDLWIDIISIPNTVLQGDTVQLTATVHNSGNSDASNVLVRWWPNNSNEVVYLESTILEIKSKGAENVSFMNPIGYPDTGLVTTNLTVNPDGSINEENDTNNIFTREIAVSSLPVSDPEHAEAFLLGWYSLLVVVPEIPHREIVSYSNSNLRRVNYIATADGLLSNLSVELDNPVQFYLNGDSLELYKEYNAIVYGQLMAMYNEETANHFFLASELLEELFLYGEREPSEIYYYLNNAITVLKIELPPHLVIPQGEDIYNWIYDLHDYFHEQR
ncbi:MAG: CHAT domain-containing protein [Actinomycetia bacterium]|nr:CHAT domain-containing protein [Actinomycetes bacterium]